MSHSEAVKSIVFHRAAVAQVEFHIYCADVKSAAVEKVGLIFLISAKQAGGFDSVFASLIAR